MPKGSIERAFLVSELARLQGLRDVAARNIVGVNGAIQVYELLIGKVDADDEAAAEAIRTAALRTAGVTVIDGEDDERDPPSGDAILDAVIKEPAPVDMRAAEAAQAERAGPPTARAPYVER